MANKQWQCQECGKLLTFKQAERAFTHGCPRCNSSDVDLAPDPQHSDERLGLSYGQARAHRMLNEW